MLHTTLARSIERDFGVTLLEDAYDVSEITSINFWHVITHDVAYRYIPEYVLDREADLLQLRQWLIEANKEGEVTDVR